MKSYAALCLSLSFFLFVSPVLSLDFENFSKENVKAALPLFKEEAKAVVSAGHLPDFKEKKEEENPALVHVLSTVSGEVLEMEEVEYLVGCVAGEMPASYHEEALKAQAVAAYTNLKRLQKDKKEGDVADISDDTKRHQAYVTKEKRQELWGEHFEAYNQKIENAVRAVLGEALYADGHFISAVFFSQSAGRSESAKNIWGGSLPYLQSVTCPGDKLAPDMVSTVKYTPEGLQEALEKEEGIDFSGEPTAWFEEVQKSDSGSGVVTTIIIGGKAFRGNDFRTLLSLKSPAFTVEFSEGQFIFTVSGHGHFVGMSQRSADYMAKNGSDYREILSHFYPSAVLQNGAQAI